MDTGSNPSRRTMLGLLLGLAARPSWADGVVVIVHKDNDYRISRELVQKLYTGAVRGWPDGANALVLDQREDSEARAEFSAQVLSRSAANVRAIWAQNIFTGRGLPPKAVSAQDMAQLVASHRNAIGYMRASKVRGDVKVLDF